MTERDATAGSGHRVADHGLHLAGLCPVRPGRGGHGEEPQYTYEKDMQVIPTFGVLCPTGGR